MTVWESFNWARTHNFVAVKEASKRLMSSLQAPPTFPASSDIEDQWDNWSKCLANISSECGIQSCNPHIGNSDREKSAQRSADAQWLFREASGNWKGMQYEDSDLDPAKTALQRALGFKTIQGVSGDGDPEIDTDSDTLEGISEERQSGHLARRCLATVGSQGPAALRSHVAMQALLHGK